MYPAQSTPPSFDWPLSGLDSGTLDNTPFPCLNFMEESAVGNTLTPPVTPDVHLGPRLVPRIRNQDQIAEPAAVTAMHRSQSAAPGNYHVQGDPYIQHAVEMARSSISPARSFQPLTPGSDHSPSASTYGRHLDPAMLLNTTPSRPLTNHARSVSASAVLTHARNVSSSSIDGSVLNRFGYPTYRNMPQCTPDLIGNRPRTVSALSHLMPNPMPASPMSSAANLPQAMPITPPQSSLPIRCNGLATSQPMLCTDVLVHPDDKILSNHGSNISTPESPFLSPNTPTTTLQNYLSTPNPSPSLIRRPLSPTVRGQATHFWYDIRQLRRWTDFTTQTISSFPGLLDLLRTPVPCADLLTPKKGTQDPETLGQLHEVLRDFFCVKVNAALKKALGEKAIEMRSLTHSDPTSGPRTQPEFIANYADDADAATAMPNFYSERDGQRGRVVGVVKPYAAWNSGQRNSSPPDQIRYLAGLATLHHFMRQHGCRYGFLCNEIEIVCVRMGGNGGDKVPLFGFLEVADPVCFSTHCTPSAGSTPSSFCPSPSSNPTTSYSATQQPLQMTGPLALFYLLLLSKSQPLPGQYSWSLDIGPPAALTRQKCASRDAWMPKPNMAEQRAARRGRGWVWPEEGLSRFERRACGSKTRAGIKARG